MGCVGRGEGIACIAVALIDLDGASRAHRLRRAWTLRRPARSLARRVKLGPLGPLADVPFNLEHARRGGRDPAGSAPTSSRGSAASSRRWGASPAPGSPARRSSTRTRPIVDRRGSASSPSPRLHGARTRSPARSRDEGVGPGDGVAIMCRNHRGFVEATLAFSKLGANGLYMNTAFAGPQLADVIEREQPAALIYDEEFADLLGDARRRTRAASSPGRRRADRRTRPLEELIARRRRRPRPARRAEPVHHPHLGDDRDAEGRPARAARHASARWRRCSRKIPLRAGEPTMIAAPLFHSWGFAHFMLGLALGSTYVLQPQVRPRGDAEGDRRARARPRSPSCR